MSLQSQSPTIDVCQAVLKPPSDEKMKAKSPHPAPKHCAQRGSSSESSRILQQNPRLPCNRKKRTLGFCAQHWTGFQDTASFRWRHESCQPLFSANFRSFKERERSRNCSLMMRLAVWHRRWQVFSPFPESTSRLPLRLLLPNFHSSQYFQCIAPTKLFHTACRSHWLTWRPTYSFRTLTNSCRFGFPTGQRNPLTACICQPFAAQHRT